jgi:hypothetical protein
MRKLVITLLAGKAPNKCIMVGILLAGKALIKSPYAKRYEQMGTIEQ